MMAIIADFFINLFRDWISLFAAPIKNADMLWILIPVYLGWAFTEFYQEKKGTSYGNAISNGIIVLWVGVDWVRTTFNIFRENNFSADSLIATKFFISAMMFAYGLLIIVHAIKAKKASFYIGKIRLVTYAVVMFTPVFYDVVHLTFSILLAIVIFFPLFYIIVELLDFIIPDPAPLTKDLGESENQAAQPYQNYQNLQAANQGSPYYSRYPNYSRYQGYQGYPNYPGYAQWQQRRKR